MNKNVEFITKTALLMAVALVIQIGLAPFAQPVVGPLVNMVLLLSVVLVGPWGAVIVGCMTPIIAFLLGIMPLLPVIPVIMLGNCAYVLVFNAAGQKNRIIGVAAAALMKFLLLAGGVRFLVMFFLPNLPAPVVVALSLPQLYTALIGGALAMVIARYLPKRMIEARWE